MSTDDNRCRCGDAVSCGCLDRAAAERVPGDPPHFRHSAILGRMLDRIARAEAFGARPLAGLGTRATDDPAIALLSAAAGTAHVLGWTLHRLYADGTLTATEDRAALASLTGLLGHEPRPALSASTVLSFTLDDLQGAMVTIPKGTKVASIPAQGEKPQTFETDAEIEARTQWNAVRPLRAPDPPQITTSTAEITVDGVDLNARVGDRVLVWAGESAGKVTWVLARVTAVKVDSVAAGSTAIGSAAAGVAAPSRTVLALAGQHQVTAPTERTTPAAEGTMILLGARAQAFGATAPDITFMPDSVRETRGEERPDKKLPTEWKDFRMGPPATESPPDTNPRPVHLDAVHPEAAPGRAVVFETSGGTPAPAIGRIASAVETSRSDFGLSAPCTLVGIEIDPKTANGFNTLVRQTVIHLETARTNLVVPPADPVLPLTDTSPEAVPQHRDLPRANQPDRLYVEGILPLPPGRRVVITGSAADGTTTVVEAATISSATTASGTAAAGPAPTATLLVFTVPLTGRWRASTLTILGNSVAASQGETPTMGAETLGSGNPATPLPRYALKQKPLAHVSATTPTGYAPAIEVRVNGRAYDRADSLFGEGPDSRRFRVLARGDGGSDVQFAGRLPSGTGKVVALYRTGGGSAGNLAQGRLTQLMTPVLGVRSVTNAVRAEGGSDPETLDEIRTAAPKAIRTLDRAVALADYEAFAEGYRGVGKASAVELCSGMRRIICVTIATTSLRPPEAGSDLVTDLREAILAAAPPGTHVRIEGFDDLPMSLEISLATDPTLRRGDVEAAVRTALEHDFGRAARSFGEAVHRSQVLATVQGVPGVVAALLTTFSAPGVTEDAEGRLPCRGPNQLLSVSTEAITFTELTP